VSFRIFTTLSRFLHHLLRISRGRPTHASIPASRPAAVPMAAIYDGVSSLLRALPAGLLLGAQDGEPALGEPPSPAHRHFLIPEMEAHAARRLSRAGSHTDIPEMEAHAARRLSRAGSTPTRASSSPSAPKRVSWADRPVQPEGLKPRTPVRRSDGEHPLRKRLLDAATAEQTALAHVARARELKASSSSSKLPEWRRSFSGVGNRPGDRERVFELVMF